jgi:hypothetical protein
MRRRSRLPTWLLVLCLTAVVAAVAVLLPEATTRTTSGGDAARVTAGRTPLLTSRFVVGTTLTQHTLMPGGDSDARASGEQVLRNSAQVYNVQIMGFGLGNPEPSPGVFDWRTLDARMNQVRALGGTPVITLFGAPTWMVDPNWKGGTNWQLLNHAVLPNRVQDFAELARAVALRYPFVHYFQVWNELKGMWDSASNNWNMGYYTTLYNRVYDTLKSVNPTLQVGGPYLTIEGTGTDKSQWATAAPITSRDRTNLEYWLTNMHGADFIAVDRGVIDYHDHNHYTAAQQLALTANFGSIVDQLRAMTSLPIWFSELYSGVTSDPQLSTVQMSSILYELLTHGASVGMGWAPEQNPDGSDGAGTDPPLFSSTARPGGGQPLSLASVYQLFKRHFPPGTAVYEVNSTSSSLRAVASPQQLLLINEGTSAITVQGAASSQLAGYATNSTPRRR